MSRFFKSFSFAMATVAIVTAPVRLHAQTIGPLPAAGSTALSPIDAVAAPFAGVSIKVGDEKVQPGGIAQVKVFVTEPMPISTAGASLSFGGFSAFEGIALNSPARDTLGVAVIRGSELTLSILSPSGTFGTNPDYPILTVAGRVPATAQIGTTFALDVDEASLHLTDASGAVYPFHVRGGELVIAPILGIDDVVPGSADVATEGVVTILGRGFEPTTKVKFKEVLLSHTDHVDSSHLQVTLAQPTHMHGQGIMIENRDGTQSRYFSYQRTTRQGASIHPALLDAVPIFSDSEVTEAFIDVGGATTGLALQNRQAFPILIGAELLDLSGRPQAIAAVTVYPSQFVLAELSELFGVAYSPSQVVRVRSPAPIQVMGVAVDAAAHASPIAPR